MKIHGVALLIITKASHRTINKNKYNVDSAMLIGRHHTNTNTNTNTYTNTYTDKITNTNTECETIFEIAVGVMLMMDGDVTAFEELVV